LIGVSALSLVGLVVLLALLWLSAEERAETVKSLSQAKLSLMDLQSQAREAQKHAAVQEALADQKRRELAELSKRADEQANNAKVAAGKAESVIYAADTQFARAAWENDNLERMLSLLKKHRPAQGQAPFEWRYLWRLAHPEGRSWHVMPVAKDAAGKELPGSPPGVRLVLSPDRDRLGT